MFDKIYKILGKVHWSASALGGGILFLLAFLTTLDVSLRYFANRPLVGVFEISEVVFLICVFLGLGMAEHNGTQIRVDLLFMKVKNRPRYVLEILNMLVALAFFGVMFWTGAQQWLENFRGNWVRQGMIHIPMTIPLGVLVFGSLLLVIACVMGTIIYIRKFKSPTMESK